ADGDVETLCGESRTQGVCHDFGVAKVAHISILCLNETGGARACVADPFVRAKATESCDTFTVPRRAQAAGRIYPQEGWPTAGSVSIACRLTTDALRCPSRGRG